MSLLEELKRRGRAAVGLKAWPDAKALYGKAIEIYPESNNDNNNDNDNNSRDKAILYSNRSLCELQMNQLDNARDDAEMATVLDPTYVKGYWRLGSAHAARTNETAQALKAYQNALSLDPKNMALQKETRKLEQRLQKELEEEKEKPQEEDATTTTPPPLKKTTTTVVKPTSSITEEKKSNEENSNQKNKDNHTNSTGKEDTHFSASDKIRGYKMVGGKKTSYFHHEQTEEEKRLIGDIAPKRITTPTTLDSNDESDNNNNNDKSVWNKAGTWEERDVTAWAIKTLTETLSKCQYNLPAEIMSNGEGIVKVTKVTKLTSHTDGGTAHASYATVRGKKRYIYEFSIGLNWELTLPGDDDKASGTMTFPDVDGTCEPGEGYDLVEFTVNREKSTASTQPIVQKFVQHGGLRNTIHDAIDSWVCVFRDTY